jgi:multiple sugar transport system substrate-binding protein
VILSLVLAGCAGKQAKVEKLTIMWAQWDPASFLATLAQEYPDADVEVIQEPWGSFYDRVSAEWAAGGDSFDMVVGDSQWLGQGATQGHYVDMTDMLVDEGLADTVTEATLTYYGEYPTGSGRYFAFPTEGDALGFHYRKDLFEHPDEMAAFEAEHGYPLAAPKTLAEMMDIAKFFTRDAGETLGGETLEAPFYGVALTTDKAYSGVTEGLQMALFTSGARWQNPETNEVIGWVNSPEAVGAVQWYRDMYACCQPPGGANIGHTEINNYMINGQIAMGISYVAFLYGLHNPEINPHAEGMGFFANPAGPTGERHASLGGQGMSINAHISEERIEASKDFIRWFAQKEQQEKWAKLGGLSCNKEVLEADWFLEVSPVNPVFAESMTMVMDFWNVPEYGELLQICQRHLHAFVVGGEGTAQGTMDAIAQEHDAVLRAAGRIKE